MLSLDDETRERFKRDFRSTYYSKYLMRCSLYPGIKEALGVLSRDHVLAVATNKEKENTVGLLTALGIADRFAFIEGSRMIGDRYTKAMMIEAIVERSRIGKDLAVMVGDGVSDFEAACESGIGFLGVGYGFGDVSRTGSEVISRPSELIGRFTVGN